MRSPTLVAILSASAVLVACQEPSSGSGPAASTSAPVAQSAAVSATAATASASASASASAAASATPPDKMRGRGLAGMFLRAARDLTDLEDAQKTALEKAADALRAPDGDAMRTEMKSFHDDLVAGVKAGKIDAAKMTAHYAAIDKFGQARADKEADALNGVYAALEPAQRKALATAVRAKQASRDERMKQVMAAMDGGAPDWTKKRLDKMTADLGLDAMQAKAVGALMAKGPMGGPGMVDAMRDAGKKRMESILAAFEKDGFDAKKLDMAMIPGKKPHDMLQQHVDFTNSLLGVLKADQREKLVATMDRKPDAMREPSGMAGGWSEGTHDDD